MDIVVALLVVGLVILWVRKSTADAAELRRREDLFAARRTRRRPAPARDEDVLDCGGIWARHPLEPDLGWMVATTATWALRSGDRLCVTRKDGSESLETVERVVLELREPDGGVVGHLVEVENA
ncbi:MAG: hypothetical protein OXR82_19915 [Gammaproteobacteria bacterium]|nr:hypothetical protein [Gammaproteobacteria bacterium]MDE0260640.1 hypothetical protein [Gammaproteobacteria bacterium]